MKKYKYVLSETEYQQTVKNKKQLNYLRDKMFCIKEILQNTKDFDYKLFTKKLGKKLDELEKEKG